MGCKKGDGSVSSLRELADQLELASSTASGTSNSIKVRVNLSGTLIFASPYSVDRARAQLTAAVGAKAADKIISNAGMSEFFHICLVTPDGQVKAVRWERPISYNELFIVKCQPGNELLFEIHENAVRAIKVDPNPILQSPSGAAR